jgi:radical SAM protein with 4Fe4S-binding SPASM domain
MTDSILYTPKLDSIQKGDVTLFVDSESPNWVAVNNEGGRVISLCDGKRTVDEIVSKLNHEFSREEVLSFIERAINLEIVGKEPYKTKIYPGRASYLSTGRLSEIWLYVTRRCNLKCRHCLLDCDPNSRKELSTQEFKDILDVAKEMGVDHLFLTGGEPFLRSDVFDLIEYAKEELNLSVVVLTNGTLLSAKDIERLGKFEGLTIQVSLEGPSELDNTTIRGSGNFVKTLKAIELLINKGVKVIVTSTATKENVNSIPRLCDLLHSKKAQTHHILWLHERGRAVKNQIKTTSEELIDLMNSVRRRGIKVDNWSSIGNRVYGGRGIKVDGCSGGATSATIDSNGDIYPCPSLVGDHNFRLGNVVHGFEKVWKDFEPKVDLKKVSILDIEGCYDCTFRFFCGGGCRCQAYYSGGRENITSKDPYCEVIKSMLIESMMSLTSPNGQGRPEFLGYMKKKPIFCSSNEQEGVKQFHCTCVLDLPTDKHRASWERYRTAAQNPQKDLCCPTGYSTDELEGIPKGTIAISYGCGNPTALGELKPGERVLDIGSGGGIDCFIAAKKVGRRGLVIGVDMTDEMISLAEKNKIKIAETLGYDVVEFRKGLIEDLPVESDSIDKVISNCTINLSPNKKRVFEEIFRVLSDKGSFSISDIVSDRRVPEEIKNDDKLWSGCIGGALPRKEFLNIIQSSGFNKVRVEKSQKWKELKGINFYSITVNGKKA